MGLSTTSAKLKTKKQPQPPAQEPELQEIVNVLAALPTQPVAEILPPVEISQLVDSISETQSDIEGPQATMAAAFKQFLNKREYAAATK
jgi:hypothetical protein